MVEKGTANLGTANLGEGREKPLCLISDYVNIHSCGLTKTLVYLGSGICLICKSKKTKKIFLVDSLSTFSPDISISEIRKQQQQVFQKDRDDQSEIFPTCRQLHRGREKWGGGEYLTARSSAFVPRLSTTTNRPTRHLRTTSKIFPLCRE